ncbi:hypothetical protein [Candidatus Poriferisodalis sp.]|uniref:hypothetical protein n=1 Tax=Candidatus Poriferisodalis sp. TaxID=3101277 RepID=UPI003B52C2FF
MTSEQASAPSPYAACCADEAHVTDIEGETERVDRTRAGFDHAVADVRAEFAAHYREIAAELFDDDPDPCCRLPPREPASI